MCLLATVDLLELVTVDSGGGDLLADGRNNKGRMDALLASSCLSTADVPLRS